MNLTRCTKCDQVFPEAEECAHIDNVHADEVSDEESYIWFADNYYEDHVEH